MKERNGNGCLVPKAMPNISPKTELWTHTLLNHQFTLIAVAFIYTRPTKSHLGFRPTSPFYLSTIASALT